LSLKIRKEVIVDELLRAHKIWLWFNVGISILIAGLLLLVNQGWISELLGTTMVCGAIIVTTLGDYWINRRMYFGQPKAS
jgi:hypothetical protein